MTNKYNIIFKENEIVVATFIIDKEEWEEELNRVGCCVL